MALVAVNSNEEFVREVEQDQGLVIAGFTADWCPHCKVLAPHIQGMAQNFPDLKICRVDVDKCEEISNKYNVQTIPTLAIFKGGQLVVAKMVAGMQPNEIMEFMQSNMQ
ncbi:Thioredoxin [Anaerobiospirillum thomasii]|uniref:Thioredoxin n=1 Tax=Anaerobiospirillum thomasii TaxID=179995 RepID=A0A2X0VK54_9GAMM|nr:thioredoxin family protein [Anaerobiospirillum thomasii]SPT69848.1 Thioredoxin [Anaerobiospirillum thomasii]SPT71485.1 Thioredoxin [Anaerobiospirillum thomasii]